MHDQPLPEAIIELIEHPTRLSYTRLWRALPRGERRRFVASYLTESGDARSKVVKFAAQARRFRPQTVQQWDDEKIVGLVGSLSIGNRHQHLTRLLLTDSSRAREVDSRLAEVELGERGKEGERFLEEWRRITFDFGELRCAIAFLSMRIGDPAFDLHELWKMIEGISGGVGATTEDIRSEAAPEEPSEETPRTESREFAEQEEETEPATDSEDDFGAEDPGRQLSFTTVDRLMIEAIVDTRQGVEGALTEDELDDAVEELAQLNGRRHWSYFHIGFRDALFDRGPSNLLAENRTRARWYWAGAVQGWARSEDWDRILDAFEADDSVVARLGDGTGPASDAAARHVATALLERGQPSAAAEFAKPSAIAQEPRLLDVLLDGATRLMRNGVVADAKSILDSLMKAVRLMERRGAPVSTPESLVVRRRHARCLHLLGHRTHAKRRLARVLELDPDPGIQAMVHVDLGLLVAGFRGLSDFRLPKAGSDDDLRLFLERVRPGRGHFEDAVALNREEADVPEAAHGHYCLGVISLAENHQHAADHLAMARAFFHRDPKNYSEELLRRADLYLGIAQLHRLSESDAHPACDLVVSAMSAGEAFPAHLVDDTIAAMDEVARDRIKDIVSRLLDGGDDHVLNQLAASERALSCSDAVATALEARAEQRRDREAKAADLRIALWGHLRSADTTGNSALRVLDELQCLAAERVAIREFAQLLDEEKNRLPWEFEDRLVAIAECHERAHDFQQAARVLVELCHYLISEGRLAEADDILVRIRRYGIDAGVYSDAENRLNSERVHATSDLELGPPAKAVHILVVGGDERQQAHEDSVRKQVSKAAPQVSVDFVYSGWSSNWSRYRNEVSRKLRRNDIHAVVVRRFIRTTLGEHVRRECGECGKQWRHCWSGGTGEVTTAVLDLARAVAAK